jgi:hypothetical protein
VRVRENVGLLEKEGLKSARVLLEQLAKQDRFSDVIEVCALPTNSREIAECKFG